MPDPYVGMCAPGTCGSCDEIRRMHKDGRPEILGILETIRRLMGIPKKSPVAPQAQQQTTTQPKTNETPKAEERPTEMSNDTQQQAANLKIERKGRALLVPQDITLDVAITALQMKMEEEERVVAVNNEFEFGVAEGIVATLRVLEREYGFVTSKASNAGWFVRPPTFLGIEVAPGEQVQFPWGRLAVPGIDGWVEPNYTVRKDRVIFRLNGEVTGKDRPAVDRLVKLIKDEHSKKSIYRGQAISVSFPAISSLQALSDTFPKFTNMNPVRPEDLVFTKELADQLDVSLFTPIQRSDACRKHGISLKRGILLAGPYGVGKTMTAAATATLCKENGWTYIYLKNSSELSMAYEFAMQYQPAVIFAEDVDQILEAVGDDEDEDTTEDGRDSEVNEILNALDGIDSKGVEIITVFTTNHVDRITRALLRPGRLDTVVEMQAPNREAAKRMVRKFAGDLLDPNTDLESVGDVIAGMIPAMIKEVVERSKLAALRREGPMMLTANDIDVTARGMRSHMDLLEEKRGTPMSDAEKAASITAGAIVEAARVTHANGQNGKRENSFATSVAVPPAE